MWMIGQCMWRTSHQALPLTLCRGILASVDQSSTLSEALRLFSTCLLCSLEFYWYLYRLPRHWDSKDLKGFAYVTFSKSEEALEALKVRGVWEWALSVSVPPVEVAYWVSVAVSVRVCVCVCVCVCMCVHVCVHVCVTWLC